MRSSFTAWVLSVVFACGVPSWPRRAMAQESESRQHAVGLRALATPFSFADEPEGWGIKPGHDIGGTLSYDYFLLDWLALGVAGSIRGTFGQSSSYQTGSLSHTTVAVPLVLSFEPRILNQLRFVGAVGLAYQHVWMGPTTRVGDHFVANGYEALVDIGAALRLARTPLELVLLVGVRRGRAEYSDIRATMAVVLRPSHSPAVLGFATRSNAGPCVANTDS